MREIKYIGVHCTGSPQTQSVNDILNYWKYVKKWRNPGYHILIMPDGEEHFLLPFEQISNGVRGYNGSLINIAYLGGIDEDGKATDNRTPQQKRAMFNRILELKKQFPNAEIKGHRDFSPDLNNDGHITADEFIKECPSFDVRSWLSKMGVE